MAERDSSAAIEVTENQQRALFEEIARLANHAQRVVFYGPVVGSLRADDPNFYMERERLELQMTQLRDLFARIGLFADMGAMTLGDTGVTGGVEEWLLPPTYPRSGVEVASS